MLVNSSHGACGIAIFMAEITQSGRAVTVVLGSVLCIGQVTGFSLFTLLRAASKVLSLKDRFRSLLQDNSSQVWPRTCIPANWLTRCDLLQDAGVQITGPRQVEDFSQRICSLSKPFLINAWEEVVKILP